MTKVISQLATAFAAWHRAEDLGLPFVSEKHAEMLHFIEHHLLPRGSGFDSGCHLDYEVSTPNRIVIQADFHHMNGNGFYTGWTEHTVVITPSLAFGFEVKVTGQNQNLIKDYIADVFIQALMHEFDFTEKMKEIFEPSTVPDTVSELDREDDSWSGDNLMGASG